MLSLHARRVALSARRSTATCTLISQPSTPALRYRRIFGNSLCINAVRSFANPQRNASTRAAAAADGANSTVSTTAGKRKPRQISTPEDKAIQRRGLQAKELGRKKKVEQAAALRAKRKAQAEKEKEAAARKRLVEKKKKEAEKEKAKKEAQKEKMKIIKPPPRRMNSFALFWQESRNKKPVHEISADWNNLSEEVKQDYAVRAQAVLEERKEAFNTFIKSVAPSDIRRYNRHQKSKGKNRIRVPAETSRPLGSFISFTREFRKRPDQVGKRIALVSCAAAEEWRSFTQEEKDKYKVVPSESTTV